MVSEPKFVLFAMLWYTFDPECPFNRKTLMERPFTELTSRPKDANSGIKKYITQLYSGIRRIQEFLLEGHFFVDGLMYIHKHLAKSPRTPAPSLYK